MEPANNRAAPVSVRNRNRGTRSMTDLLYCTAAKASRMPNDKWLVFNKLTLIKTTRKWLKTTTVAVFDHRWTTCNYIRRSSSLIRGHPCSSMYVANNSLVFKRIQYII